MIKLNKKGFTLIELLVVISIISLLSSIVLASLNKARKKGDDAAKIRTLLEVRNALNIYYNDSTGGNGNYPSGNNLITTLVPKFISKIDTKIIYQSTNKDNTICSSNCQSYQLTIILTDKNSGVLYSDKDITGVINGKKDDCSTAGTGPSIPDLCYDLTP